MTPARWGSAALGVGLVLFSGPAVLAPRFFGNLVGLRLGDQPAQLVPVRGVALRDVVTGAALALSARGGRPLRPWLAVRALCDAGDTLAIGLAFFRGGGGGRLALLGLIAGGATACDCVLWWLAGEERRPDGGLSPPG